jgi:ribosomal protein L4
MPKKARRRATQSALLSKLRDGEVTLVEALPDTGKTRDVAAFLKALGLTHREIVRTTGKRPGKEKGTRKRVPERALLVVAGHNAALAQATRNLQNVHVSAVEDLNAYDLLAYRQMVLTKGSLDTALALYGVSGEETAEAATAGGED